MGGFNTSQLQEMLEQAQKQAQELQSKMRQTVVEASVGGGSVTVKMDGQKRLLSISIAPAVVQGGDMEMLQDLITAAVNEAGRKVDAAMQSTVGGMLGGLGLPGL
jgi:DNA-binding YbaB/EbfC family protein